MIKLIKSDIKKLEKELHQYKEYIKSAIDKMSDIRIEIENKINIIEKVRKQSKFNAIPASQKSICVICGLSHITQMYDDYNISLNGKVWNGKKGIKSNYQNIEGYCQQCSDIACENFYNKEKA